MSQGQKIEYNCLLIALNLKLITIMPLINWSEKLSVNILEIDNQHKKLVGMLNKLFDAMQIGRSNEVLRPLLVNMVDYAKHHFATEEKYVEKYNYPEAEKHISKHKEFIAKINQFIKDFNSGKIGLSSEILHFLRTWITEHIQGVAKQYSDFFNQKGLR
ncbi:MAG TPA: bacteriohemerythrin [Sunxiuqinia sp.]|nr:bacteriohemerythrin [Sunxiuqinia sp.]